MCNIPERWCFLCGTLLFLLIGLPCFSVTIIGVAGTNSLTCLLVNKSFIAYTVNEMCMNPYLWQLDYQVVPYNDSEVFQLCSGASLFSQGCLDGSRKKGPTVCNPILSDTLEVFNQTATGSRLPCYQFQSVCMWSLHRP